MAMTFDQAAILAILAAVIGLLIWGRWRYDLVAFAALVAALLIGVVPAAEAFTGFGHPATITVALILVLSRALSQAGATDWAVKLTQPLAGRTDSHIVGLAGLGALLSSIMNNVGTLGLLMPVALQSAAKAKRSAALILMPLSFGCILGGLLTLIGTPPNIIVAAYRGRLAGEPFAMFDFTPVGGPVALAGLVFLALIGWRLVPARAQKGARTAELIKIEDYVSEVRIPKGSPAAGKTRNELYEETKDIDVAVVGLLEAGEAQPEWPGRRRFKAGDSLLIEASPEEIDKFVKHLGLELAGEKGKSKDEKGALSQSDFALAEAVVSPRSSIVGRSAASLRLPGRFGINLLAVSRQGKPFRGRLKNFTFRVGDILLLHGEPERLQDAISAWDCLPLAGRDISFGRRAKGPWLVLLFAAAIAATSLGLLQIQVALAAALALAVALNLFPLREVCDAIDWPVIVLLGALLPLGGALEASGATALIAGTILELGGSASPALVLTLVLVATMTLSDVLNNAATAVVMAPIGASLAERLDCNPDAFLMAAAVGASSAFLTPIGHQNNALVLGPGGYQFGDYWRMGLPLEVVIVAVAVPAILYFWPL